MSKLHTLREYSILRDAITEDDDEAKERIDLPPFITMGDIRQRQETLEGRSGKICGRSQRKAGICSTIGQK